ncbi:MAG: hypothetical protein ABI706_12180 [Ilumatobacteraceae bacterium]
MWIHTKHTTVALALLLTSCGTAAVSSTSDVSTPDQSDVTKPTINDFDTTVTASTVAAPATDAGPVAAIQAAFPSRLALTAKDGHVYTFSPGEDPIDTPGVMDPTGQVVVSSDTLAGVSTIEWHHVRNDQISASVQIKGEVRPTAIAQDGKVVALVGIAGKQTTVVLATPSEGEVRRWTFDAHLVPEAFANAFQEGSDLPMGVFVIEYLDTNTYRVRVIDTATGQLGLPLNLRDKSQTVDEVMTAVSRTAVFEPNNQLLFTLYQGAGEGGEQVGSFIHTLGLFNGVWCLDVPAQLGLADHPGALAVNPAGSRLFAASSTGGIAGYEVSDITNYGPEMPLARATTAVQAAAGRVAIGASQDEVVLALGGSLFRLDPVTLAVRDSFAWDMDVEALTVLDDGNILIVGTGRMSLISPDNTLLAERALPANTGEITRVAVVA